MVSLVNQLLTCRHYIIQFLHISVATSRGQRQGCQRKRNNLCECFSHAAVCVGYGFEWPMKSNGLIGSYAARSRHMDLVSVSLSVVLRDMTFQILRFRVAL
jgi:hypothetical protein